MFKSVIAAAGFAALTAMLSAVPAYAASCTDRANACMANGGNKETCFGKPFASCKKTGSYVGPYSGKAFPASVRN